VIGPDWPWDRSERSKHDAHSAIAEPTKEVLIAPIFPTGPKLELDELLGQLIERAQDVISTQGRLRGLLRANQSIAGNVDLPVLLKRIVEAACELTGARYGALGVNGAEGGLEQFVHVGMDDATVAALGAPPEGHGLLGAMISDARPIRLAVMSDDPRSSGFPPGHPPMTAFLGVPVRVRDEAFGSLYLTDPAAGEFAVEDEELVLALAAAAGVAIENAWLHDEGRRRQGWLEASTEVTQALLSEDGQEPLLLIARQALAIGDADEVTLTVARSGADDLVVQVAADAHPRVEGAETLAPVMILPLVGLTRTKGALTIARAPGRRHFAEADREMAMTFANHAAIALELADARDDQQRIALLEDRDRIARDLHDHVIQRLFGLGLTVQSVLATLGSDERATRLQRVVSDMDETIRQVRTTIFQLRGPLNPGSGAMRARLLGVVSEATGLLGFAPRVRFDGPFDAAVPDELEDDLLAVLRESLTNCVRHAHASSVEVEVTVTSERLSVRVADNGRGIGDRQRLSGLRNLRERAEKHSGSLTISDGPGVTLSWTVPLPLRKTMV
jgi:signal transduction histidine kinase